jgi:hypothetical protein
VLKRMLAPGARPTILWVAGTCLLLVRPLLGVFATAGSFAIPSTPMDRVNGQYANMWMLLEQAKEVIPAAATYTAVSRGGEEEESLLFILSLGILTDRTALPNSYWSVHQAGQGDRARYVVSLGCLEPTGAHRLVRRIVYGCVFERPEGLR